jgi:hypothetical protein
LNVKIKNYEKIKNKQKTEKEKEDKKKKLEKAPGQRFSPAAEVAHGPISPPKPVPSLLSPSH